MNIIVVGCGKVGSTLIEQLNNEGNNITAIDVNSVKIKNITQKCDVMGLIGNGATHNILIDAGVTDADLVIAVTGSDELNMLCCLHAKKAGPHCQTIARIRNPEYLDDTPFIREELGLAMVINPERAAAMEIARVLRFPSAIKIDTFAKGKMELLKFRLPVNNPLEGVAVKEITTRLHCDVLVCMIQRGDQVIIPGGNMTFQPNDLISITATPLNAARFFKKINLYNYHTKTVMIAGGSDIAYYLGKELASTNITVKIIERNTARCGELCDKLPKASVINGDLSDKETLLEEGLQQMGAFVALTNMDEENILLSLFARSQMKGKLVTKINRIEFDEIIQQLDLDTIVNPKHITADYIVQFVRAMKNSIGSNVETLYNLIPGKVEASEFRIKENSAIVGIPLQKLNFKDNVLIAGIVRNRKMILPRGQDSIEIGDSVVVVSSHLRLHDICDILRKA